MYHSVPRNILRSVDPLVRSQHAMPDDADAAPAIGFDDDNFGLSGLNSGEGTDDAAEQSYQQAVVSLAQARTNRYADTAALFQALGGSVAPLAAAH